MADVILLAPDGSGRQVTAGTTHRSQMRNNQEFSGCKTIKSAAATRVAATRCHLTIFGRIAFLRGGCISHGSAESRQRLDSGAESLLLSSSLLLVVFPFFFGFVQMKKHKCQVAFVLGFAVNTLDLVDAVVCGTRRLG